MSEEKTMLDLSDDLQGDLDFEVIPAGTEAELRIREASIQDGKKPETENLLAILEPVEFSKADLLYVYMGIPNENDDERTRTNKARRIDIFYRAFAVDGSAAVDLKTDLPGLTGFAIIDVDEYEGIMRNRVKRFVAPK